MSGWNDGHGAKGQQRAASHAPDIGSVVSELEVNSSNLSFSCCSAGRARAAEWRLHLPAWVRELDQAAPAAATSEPGLC